MDQEQARRLIGNTFQNKFDKTNFAKFIAEYLSGVDFDKGTGVLSGKVIRAAFQDRIASYERIGQYTDPDNKVIDILVVNLKKDTTLERGRTGLRNFAADYLQTDRGTGKAAVLLAYVSPEKAEWRFSFVSLETALVQTEKGTFTESIESITPARRKSFLVGEFEKTHTAQSRFQSWLQKREGPTLQQIEDCFDVESVTKEFFGKYKQLFERTRDAIVDACEKDNKVRSEFIAKGMYELDEDGDKVPFADDFAKKLLGQIVFLYFLQKKGWFGVPRDEEWGSGDRNFLRSLFDNCSKYKPHTLKRDLNFYEDILEPLFYNTLAVKRTHDWSDRFHCKIPFLNGGLFEAIYGYDWSAFELLLPDALFSNKTNAGEEGDGILDVFDLYNFTINEAEPLETEVAVDPEMLGKIFENLLPENVRHGSGTYYTPRVIVAYMCQQSLINYLATHLPDTSRDDIEAFIRFGAIAADYTEGGAAKDKDKYLSDAIQQNAAQIEELLRKITVCDPAIGSGAFPVGMMQEIVKAREALRGCEGIPARTQYQLKRETIENCLYGVDIDPGAVEIAKLRLWLSLIVDEVDYQTIEPLPNLDYKIMQGNSLLDEFHGVKLLDETLFEKPVYDGAEQLADLQIENERVQREYVRVAAKEGTRSPAAQKLHQQTVELANKINSFDVSEPGKPVMPLLQELDPAHKKLETLKAKMRQFIPEADHNKKETLRAEIEKLEWEFIEAKLRADGKSDELADLEEAQASRRKPYFLWYLNYPEIFERGGFDTVIANPPYGIMFDETTKEAYERNYPVFRRNTDVYVAFFELAISLLKSGGALAFITPNTYLNGDYYSSLRSLISGTVWIRELVDFKHHSIFDIPTVFVSVLTGIHNPNLKDSYIANMKVAETSPFDFSDRPFSVRPNTEDKFKPSNRILERLRNDPNMGVLDSEYLVKDVGFNYWTRGKGKKRDGDSIGNRVLYSGRKAHANDRAFLKGRDIAKWTYRRPENWLRHDYHKFLDAERDTFRFSANFLELSPKVIYRQTANTIIATIDRKGYFLDKTVHLIVPRDSNWLLSPELLTGLLNSRLFSYLYRYISQETDGRAFAQVKTTYIKQLPIPLISSDICNEIESQVKRILQTKETNAAADTAALERKVDILVNRLYQLTDEEAAAIGADD